MRRQQIEPVGAGVDIVEAGELWGILERRPERMQVMAGQLQQACKYIADLNVDPQLK
ncbi:MAG TPA: hypothetical protein VF063_04280 [Gaiellaceae bacterium]